MNKLLQFFNELLSGFQQKPIKTLICGATNLEITGYLLEYLTKFGGAVTISDVNINNLKTAKTIFSNLLGKYDINFYLGDASNFISPEWDFIFLDVKTKEESERAFKKMDLNKTIVVDNLLNDSGPYPILPAGIIKELELGVFIPGKNNPGVTEQITSEFINDVNKTNSIKFAEVNGEKFLITTFYGTNRASETLEYHKKVMNHWKIPCNYVGLDFTKGISHGNAANFVIENTKNLEFDYWLFIDNDCIFLNSNVLRTLQEKSKDHETLVGPVQQSNHLFNKNINEKSFNHPYVGLFCLTLSKKLWNKLGQPSLDANNNSDNAEELTYLCEERGYNVFQIWPKSCLGMTDEECLAVETPLEHKKSKVGCSKFGLSTIYGQDFIFHGFCQNVSRSRENFIKKCKEVLGE